MLKVSVYCLIVAIAGCLLLAAPAAAAEGINGNLVTVDWLARHLNDDAVVILDTSTAKSYGAKHIPGAVNVDLMTYGVEDPPAAEMERRFQSWGISPERKVVLYDQGGSMTATRILYSLDYYGFPVKNLLLLDGGLTRWQEKGLAVTKDLPPEKRGSFRIRRINDGIRVRLPEILTASGDPAGSALIEALGPGWHFGEVAPFDRGGHIPNGILLPSADFFNADKTFKSPDEIRRMLAYVGVGPEQQIYTYCGGGVAASVPFFALKYILNFPRVKLYNESEMGWLSDERTLPYWTYDAPFLMRASNWLQWSGGKMLRTYGTVRVSIVDIRPAEAFNQGHVPFALNVPAEVFKANLATPAKLAEILGAAGVNPSHEAVVVSGAGLNRDAALAFLMLEKLGQRKVSLFMDSMDQWARLGFPTQTDPTVVGPQKAPRDLSIPPVPYPASIRSEVMIADAKATHGLYPKVFIASGKDLPAKTQDGKVVHVPYTDLLNPDGTPKAAKEIWSTLAKAGVPRFAEIVCFSDDPAEAAANYFVLKLMGFPDIKVLVI